MVLPLGVDDLEQEDPLMELHDLGADLLLLGFVDLLRARLERGRQLGLGRARDFLHRDLEAEGITKHDRQACGIGALGGDLGVEGVVEEGVGHVL